MSTPNKSTATLKELLKEFPMIWIDGSLPVHFSEVTFSVEDLEIPMYLNTFIYEDTCDGFKSEKVTQWTSIPLGMGVSEYLQLGTQRILLTK